MGNKRVIKLVSIIVLFSVALLYPWLVNDYSISLLIRIFQAVVLAMGLRFIFLTGQMNMGHAAFMGIGAYASALLTMHLKISFWLALPLAGIIAVIIAVPIGLLTLRIKGAYFAIVSLGLAEIIRLIFTRWTSLFGGIAGLFNIPRPEIPIIGYKMINQTSFYYLIFIIFILVFLVLRKLEKSRIGLIFNSIAQADEVSQSVGINIMKYKVLSFAVGVFVAGICGSFYAHYFVYLSPNDFGFAASTLSIVYLIVGGISSIFGALIGPAFNIIIGELLTSFKDFLPLVYGLILVTVMLWLPNGLMGIIESLIGFLRSRRAGKNSGKQVLKGN